MRITFTFSLPGLTLHLTLFLLALLGASALHALDPFTRISTGAVVSGANSTTLAWGDFNNDGGADRLGIARDIGRRRVG